MRTYPSQPQSNAMTSRNGSLPLSQSWLGLSGQGLALGLGLVGDAETLAALKPGRNADRDYGLSFMRNFAP